VVAFELNTRQALQRRPFGGSFDDQPSD
jgi:hypothetical protein